MDRLHLLLRGTLNRDEAHRRPARRLADRLGVAGVVLVGFDERPYEPRRDEPHLVTELLNLARPVVRARTCLHRHQAPRQGPRRAFVTSGVPETLVFAASSG